MDEHPDFKKSEELRGRVNGTNSFEHNTEIILVAIYHQNRVIIDLLEKIWRYG
jgi:hypothetical protein